MISVDNVAVEFNGGTLFSDITFNINEKDKIALMGKNGAGKSTVLKIMAGLDTPSQGRVELAGQDIFEMSEDERAAYDKEQMNNKDNQDDQGEDENA